MNRHEHWELWLLASREVEMPLQCLDEVYRQEPFAEY